MSDSATTPVTSSTPLLDKLRMIQKAKLQANRAPATDDSTNKKAKKAKSTSVAAATTEVAKDTLPPPPPPSTPSDAIVITHADVEQPSNERLEELLGPAPAAPRHAPTLDANNVEKARKERATLERHLQNAEKRSDRNNVYFDPKQIKKRFGKRNALHEFIREKTTIASNARSGRGSSATTTTSSSSSHRATALPDFNAAIAAQDNAAATSELAAAKVLLSDETGKTVRTGVRTTLDITDFVTRLQQAETAGAIGYLDERLFERPYFVTGLSTTEANPEWTQMQMDRQVLIARRKSLMEERRSLTSGRKWFTNDNGATGTAYEVHRTELRQRLAEYQPLESIELLKPDSQVREINLRWRTMLSVLLRDEYQRYVDETVRYLSRTSAKDDGTIEGLTNLYIQHIVNPVFDRYLQQIRTVTYEDQPLTAEILEQYLYDFLNNLYKLPLSMLRDPPPASGERPTKRRGGGGVSEGELRTNRDTARLRNLIGLPSADNRPISNNNNDDDGGNEPPPTSYTDADRFGGPSDFNTADDNETEIVAEYLRQALNIHASQIYIGWLRLWLEEARKQLDDAQEPPNSENYQKLQIIDRLVRKMVADREELQERRIRTIGRALPRYVPIHEREIRESYLQLLRNEIALARAEYLIETRDTWPRVLADYLSGDSAAPPSLDMALHPRKDLPALLADARETAVRRAKSIFSASSDPSIGEKAEQEIDARFKELIGDLLMYAPLLPADYVYFDHAPLDREASRDDAAEDNAWSPYALPYPLSVEQAALQATGLRMLVVQQSPQFDADEAHKNANSFRSILSYDYAERLVLRAIAEINYYLEKIMVPERQVPFVRDITVNSSETVRLTSTLELRPEFELAKRQPTALRDPRIDTLIDRLNATAHRVTWHFKPAYGAGAGVERVVHQELLPPGQLTATLLINFSGVISRDPNPDLVDTLNRVTIVETQISANASGGGQYRAEFTEVDVADAASYKSLFVATIRVLARCRRDNAVFEVGSMRDHGECQWREYARDEKIENIVDEWRILVTRGQAAFESLVRRRNEERNLRKLTGADYELFLPPWGAEDEQSMLQHFRASQGDCNFENQFTYDVIVQRIVDRLGGQIRRYMLKSLAQLEVAAPPIDTADAEKFAQFVAQVHQFANRADNMQLFSVLVGGLRATEPMIRAIYMDAAANGAAGSWSTPERAAELDAVVEKKDVDKMISYYLSALTGEPLQVAALHSQINDIASTYAPPLREQDEPLPIRFVKSLEPSTSVSIASVPLATMINAMFLPVVWPNLTWREQRFFQTMQARFRRFANDFRFVQRRRRYYDGLLRGDKSLDHAPSLVSQSVTQRTRYTNPPVETPLFESIENEISNELASLTPHAIQQSTVWREKQTLNDAPLTKSAFDYEVAEDYLSRERMQGVFLQDEQLCREYDEKLHDLVRSGLLVPNKVAVGRFMHVRENPYVDQTWRVATLQLQNNYTTDDRYDDTSITLRTHRTDWTGIHSFTTEQPDFCQIVISRSRGAAVDVRGSVPMNKGYDFRGLHAAIVNTARQYTRVVHGEEDATLVGAFYDRALERLETRLQRLELTFNFLAFVAPPLSNNVFMPAEAIIALIDDQTSENWLKSLRATATHK